MAEKPNFHQKNEMPGEDINITAERNYFPQTENINRSRSSTCASPEEENQKEDPLHSLRFQRLLASKSPDFGTAEHWDAEYTAEEEEQHFDWLMDGPELDFLVHSLLAHDKGKRILHLGTGNSTAPFELHRQGYANQVCTDISGVCMRKMEDVRRKEGIPDRELMFVAADACDLLADINGSISGDDEVTHRRDLVDAAESLDINGEQQRNGIIASDVSAKNLSLCTAADCSRSAAEDSAIGTASPRCCAPGEITSPAARKEEVSSPPPIYCTGGISSSPTTTSSSPPLETTSTSNMIKRIIRAPANIDLAPPPTSLNPISPRGRASGITNTTRRRLFADASFDLVYEKATIDALLCHDDRHAVLILFLLKEVHRVMKENAIYLCVSMHPPPQMLCFLRLPCFGWRVRVVDILDESTAARPDGRRNYHYCYICSRKSARAMEREWERVLQAVLARPDLDPRKEMMASADGEDGDDDASPISTET